jgi:hypothetical protein
MIKILFALIAFFGTGKCDFSTSVNNSKLCNRFEVRERFR